MRERPLILVADSELEQLEVLKQALSSDYDVIAAMDGIDAGKLAREYEPDLVLLDVILPKMSGYELCNRLKNHSLTRDIPVIFTSDLTEVEDEKGAFDLGASDFIPKPTNASIVKVRVRHHLELKKCHDLLASMAFLDGLTGIPNRRGFDETFQREWMRGRRELQPLSLVMMDLDFFKYFNDSYGHLEGDACLIRVANALHDAIKRPADYVARYGGEEFVCLLPNTNYFGAKLVGKALADTVAALTIPHKNSRVGDVVTISYGVATMVPDANTLALSLIEAADNNLYEEKRVIHHAS